MDEIIKIDQSDAITLEMAVRRVCEANGRRKSVASIRRLVGSNFETFGPTEACVSFQKLGFEAQFRHASLQQLELEDLPLIAFDVDQTPIVLLERKADGSFVVIRDKTAKRIENIDKDEFEKILRLCDIDQKAF